MSVKTKIRLKRAKITANNIYNHGFVYYLSQKTKKTIGLIILDILLLTGVCTGTIQMLEPKVIFITNDAKASTLPSADLVTAGSDAGNMDEYSLRNSEVESIASTPQSTVQLIKKIAKEENFENVDGLLRLTFCESSLGRKRINYNNDKRNTIDRGLWMINSYWHREVTKEQANDDEWATRWSIRRIKEGYLSEWNCSGIFNDESYKYE